MNSLWLKNICAYKSSRNSVLTAKVIIDLKIKRRRILLKRYKAETKIIKDYSPKNIQEVLLHEARNAKIFWKELKNLLPSWCQFKSRSPGSEDITNKLLDIGYHHLANSVKTILAKYKIPSELGIIHVANNKNSAPLVYDLMEMFRGDIVDAEVIRFLKLKKIPLTRLKPKDISHFLYEVNQRLEKNYYLKNLKQCRSYKYYMELQVLKFISVVNYNKVFRPLYLPTRHDNRC